MSSLAEQLQQLKIQKEQIKQQELSLQKEMEEEEKNRKESLTLNKLKELNNQQNISIKKPLRKDIYSRSERYTNLITKPRFEIILEILKRQDNRIAKLEEIRESKPVVDVSKLQQNKEISAADIINLSVN